MTTLLVAATGFGVNYFCSVYRPDLQINNAAAQEVIRSASDGAVALLSYSPNTLDRDFTNAKFRVTESYLPYYQQFAEKIVGPSALSGQVTTSAFVVKASVAEIRPNYAVVLAFVKQKTASKDKPEPVVTSSSLQITLTKVNGSWLIEKFDAL